MLLLTTRKSRDDRKHLQNLCAVIVRPQAHRFNNCWFLPVQRRQTEPSIVNTSENSPGTSAGASIEMRAPASDMSHTVQLRACEAADRLVRLLPPVYREYLRRCQEQKQYDFLTLARRTRALFLNARAAIEMAPAVAALLASELGRDPTWQSQQIEQFASIARHYVV